MPRRNAGQRRSGATTNGLTYAQAGVDIDAGNALVERIKPAAKRTNRPGTVSLLTAAAGLSSHSGIFFQISAVMR